MSTLFQRLRAKQKADAAKREARLEKRRGYARAARERDRAKQDGLADLPVEVAVAIEEAPATPAPEPMKPPDATVEELVTRLLAVRERLFWLAAVWATTLSSDVYQEAERFRAVFHDLSRQLRAKDSAALDRITQGHEALLLSEPASPKPRISLATQNMIEVIGEIQGARSIRPVPDPDGYVADGLQSWI